MALGGGPEGVSPPDPAAVTPLLNTPQVQTPLGGKEAAGDPDRCAYRT